MEHVVVAADILHTETRATGAESTISIVVCTKNAQQWWERLGIPFTLHSHSHKWISSIYMLILIQFVQFVTSLNGRSGMGLCILVAKVVNCGSTWDVRGMSSQLMIIKWWSTRATLNTHSDSWEGKKKSFTFECDACGTTEKGNSYICSICHYLIHESCASLPITAHFHNHVQHSLSLGFYLPREYVMYSYTCAICSKTLPQTQWVYHCKLYRYVVHIKCALNMSDAATSDSYVIISTFFPFWRELFKHNWI